MKSIAVIGAGSHARSAVNLLKQHFPKDYVFGIYDDSYTLAEEEFIHGIKLTGKISDIPAGSSVFLSVGDNSRRRRFYEKFGKQIPAENLIHSTACVEKYVSMGKANQIFAFSYLNSYTCVGDNNIINSGAILEHEVKVGSHCHISVGSRLCGRVTIGDECMIGSGAVVIDNISICSKVTVGAGSVVIRNIEEEGTYVGNPARKIK